MEDQLNLKNDINGVKIPKTANQTIRDFYKEELIFEKTRNRSKEIQDDYK